MSVSRLPASPDPPSPETRREIRWDAVAAIIASLVGFLALLVAGYSAYIQNRTAKIQMEQVRAQVWPYLYMDVHEFAGDSYVFARNNGVGPVIVRSVQVLVGGKPVADWKDLAHRVNFKPEGQIGRSTLNQMVLAPGGEVRWLVFDKMTDLMTFLNDWSRFRVEARVCYASTLGETWLVTFDPPRVSPPRAVARCPSLPDAAQFFD